MPDEDFDVVVVGAGLSGVGAGCHFKLRRPGMRYVVLEGRERLGGTWDLFRYPGVRSDSDMYTLGYAFKPWRHAKAIADGASILNYIEEAAHEYGVIDNIRFNHRVTRASWSSDDSRWRIEAERGPERSPVRLSAKFLLICGGYYRYDAGYCPQFKGAESFQGQIVHPQRWSDEIDYASKRVVVVGSGATAVTLVPALAEKAAHVTMLQRSPTYIAPLPSLDPVDDRLRRWLPESLAYRAARWKRILRSIYIYRMCKRSPERVKKMLFDAARMFLGPDYDVAKHFSPRYNPWDQRLCLAPDGDIYWAIRGGRASVATDEIERFTPDGVELKSGGRLEADIIVTATGLELQPLGNIAFVVDGAPVEVSKLMTYKGFMYSGLPNLASVFGYTNASWTLRSDLVCERVCRLIGLMERKGYAQCAPRLNDPAVAAEPWVDFSSGYFQRAAGRFPSQGSREPWRMHQNYLQDIFTLRYGAIEDGVLQFARASAPVAAAPQPSAA